METRMRQHGTKQLQCKFLLKIGEVDGLLIDILKGLSSQRQYTSAFSGSFQG